MAKRYLALVLVVCMMFTLTGCPASDKKKIAKRIDRLEYYCDEVNLEGVINCFDPKDTLLLKVLLIGVGVIDNEDETLMEQGKREFFIGLNSLLNLDLPWDADDNDSVIDDILHSIKIKADEISFPSRREDVAIANCLVSLKVDGEEYQTRIDLDMIKSDGEWYIDWL